MAKKKAVTGDAIELVKELHERVKSFKPQHGITQEGIHWVQDKVQELHDSLVPSETEKSEE